MGRMWTGVLVVACWMVGVVGSAAQTAPEAPSDLRVTRVQNGVVSLQWLPPVSGPAPTGYRLVGGATPGSILGSIDLPPLPAATLAIPPGAWYIRLQALAGGQASAFSNEWFVRVGSATAPVSPSEMLGTVNGSRLALSWRNRFGGGEPTANVLEVTGTLTLSVPLGLSESFTFDGVPAGTYTFRVRAANAFGRSVPGPGVTLTFPGACSGAPNTPESFVAYAVGRTVFVKWRKAETGAAHTGYVLTASGAFNGVIPLTAAEVSSPVGPGAYTLSVAATNDCGTSVATVPITVVVP